MAKYLIINIAMPIWIGKDNNSHLKDYAAIEKKYKSKVFNKNFDIFIFEVKFVPKLGYILIKHKYQESIKTPGKAIFKPEVISRNLYDLGNADVLVDLLKEVQADKQQYKRKILVTWSHGFGYCMFNNKLTEADLNTQTFITKQESNENPDAKFQPQIKQTQEDIYNKIAFKLPQQPSILTMKEFSKALTSAGVFLDAIIFSNCFMLTADTIYALQHNVKYVVGAETTLSWATYEFGEFIEDKIELDDDFKAYLVKLAQKSFNGLPITSNLNLVSQDQVTLSIIDTTDIYLYFNALNNIISFFIDNIEDDDDLHEDIKTALSYCKDVTEGYNNKAIDLHFFLDAFYQYSEYRYTTFENNHDFINRFGFNNFYMNVSKDDQKNKTITGSSQSTGISINFPPNPFLEKKESYYRIFTNASSKFQSDFSKDINWGVFLQILENMYS